MASSRPKAYRPFRAAVYVTYIVVVGFLISLAFTAVLRGLMSHAQVDAPPRTQLVESSEGDPLSEEEAEACLEAFERLRVELRVQFAALGDLAASEGREALRIWADEIRVWEATRASIAKECKLELATGGPMAELLSPVASSLESLARTYSSHATRMVIEDASTFEELDRAFFEARRKLDQPAP